MESDPAGPTQLSYEYKQHGHRSFTDSLHHGKTSLPAPHKKDETLPSGYQYRLNVNIIKGEKASRLVILKEVRLQKDFFSDPQELVSDGFEEKALIYRIKREIIIEKILKKQMDKKQTPKT